jgi:hypothetical protein
LQPVATVHGDTAAADGRHDETSWRSDAAGAGDGLMPPNDYITRLETARREADERCSDLTHKGQDVEAARASGEGNAYSMALWWYRVMVGEETEETAQEALSLGV